MHNDFSAYSGMEDQPSYERIKPGRILVVDDKPYDSNKCAFVLAKVGGHVVRETSTPAEALQIARDWLPDVILLDIMMPETNGLELATLLRNTDCDARLMFVTGMDSTTDRIRGLRLGDQYLAKPFHPMMLLEMVDSLLRGRRRNNNNSLAHSEAGDLYPIFDVNARTVTISPDRVVQLSPKLWELLRALVAANGEYVSKSQLLRKMWNADENETSLVEVNIMRLRKRIELDPSLPELIIKAPGGYYYNLKRPRH
jgi:DNA-binding response OmpR family regulator